MYILQILTRLCFVTQKMLSLLVLVAIVTVILTNLGTGHAVHYFHSIDSKAGNIFENVIKAGQQKSDIGKAINCGRRLITFISCSSIYVRFKFSRRYYFRTYLTINRAILHLPL